MLRQYPFLHSDFRENFSKVSGVDALDAVSAVSKVAWAQVALMCLV